MFLQAIIGTIGDIDSYQLPDAKGYTAFMRHVLKVTDEERQQRREEVLGVSLKDFRYRPSHLIFSAYIQSIDPLSNTWFLQFKICIVCYTDLLRYHVLQHNFGYGTNELDVVGNSIQYMCESLSLI